MKRQYLGVKRWKLYVKGLHVIKGKCIYINFFSPKSTPLFNRNLKGKKPIVPLGESCSQKEPHPLGTLILNVTNLFININNKHNVQLCITILRKWFYKVSVQIVKLFYTFTKIYRSIDAWYAHCGLHENPSRTGVKTNILVVEIFFHVPPPTKTTI